MKYESLYTFTLKSPSAIFSLNLSMTIYTKSVSPLSIAFTSAGVFSPNFNKRSTCSLAFDS